MKHLPLISKSFKHKFTKEVSKKKLDDYAWDSLTKINIITELNTKYKKNIDFNKLEKIKTFNELDKLIENTIKK